VTLASTADIVPLVDENRVLCRIGLELINSSPVRESRRLSRARHEKSGGSPPGRSSSSSHPGINVGRKLGDAMRAVRLLTSTDPAEAIELAQVLEEENRTGGRSTKIHSPKRSACGRLSRNCERPRHRAAPGALAPGVSALSLHGWSNDTNKPSIMMSTVDGVAKGSARSVSGFDVYQALKRCEDKIIQSVDTSTRRLTVELSSWTNSATHSRGRWASS